MSICILTYLSVNCQICDTTYMNCSAWLRQAERKLVRHGIGTARLDSLVLLEDVLGVDRARLLAEPDLEITPTQRRELNNLLNRRCSHEPLAYVRGKTEFYGRVFVVSPAVLEPRPESETMIALLKKLPDLPFDPSLADIGTGSGAIGITAQLELPQAKVELIDIDKEALKITKINVDLFTLSISIKQSDLLKDVSTSYDVLLCNLPYVPDEFVINQAASYEPRIAIFGGPDGLDLYRKLFAQLQKRPSKPLYILSESLPSQHSALTEIACRNGYELFQVDDFIQVFRVSA